MEQWISKGIEILTTAGSKLILALLVFVIGRIVIGKIRNLITKMRGFKKLDPTVQSFLSNFINIGLMVILIISVIGILGVPMASVVAVLASAGLAVGMALQGALSNLAGGIMLLIFRPFNVGDYIVTSGEEGIVREIDLFYTILVTLDNRKITIPNGTLMNANVTNCSSEAQRRVDLTFNVSRDANIAEVQELMQSVMKAHKLVATSPEAPFARISGASNEAIEFTVRAWCTGSDYWTVYFDLTQQISEALGNAGVGGPAVKIVKD